MGLVRRAVFNELSHGTAQPLGTSDLRIGGELPPLSPAAVLQADSTTQSASSSSCATSEAECRPSSSSSSLAAVPSFGGVRIRAGLALAFRIASLSPASRPWVAKCSALYRASLP